MIGRASTSRPSAAGKVNRATRRTPSEERALNAALSLRATKRASSGTKVVVSDTASSPWGSWKNMKAYVYASCPPLPGRARFLTTIRATWLATT